MPLCGEADRNMNKCTINIQTSNLFWNWVWLLGVWYKWCKQEEKMQQLRHRKCFCCRSHSFTCHWQFKSTDPAKHENEKRRGEGKNEKSRREKEKRWGWPVRWKHWQHGSNAARKVIEKWGKLSKMKHIRKTVFFPPHNFPHVSSNCPHFSHSFPHFLWLSSLFPQIFINLSCNFPHFLHNFHQIFLSYWKVRKVIGSVAYLHSCIFFLLKTFLMFPQTVLIFSDFPHFFLKSS